MQVDSPGGESHFLRSLSGPPIYTSWHRKLPRFRREVTALPARAKLFTYFPGKKKSIKTVS